MPDHSYLYNRAVQVFGTRPFFATQLAIETNRRNTEIQESLDALLKEGKLILISEGSFKSYKIKDQDQ